MAAVLKFAEFHEEGIREGFQAAQLAEAMIGDRLSGTVMPSGSLSRFRRPY